MTIEASPYLADCDDIATTAIAPHSRGLRGSTILAIAAEVRSLIDEGKSVHNFTIGDFNPKYFPVPQALTDAIKGKLDAGHTNYPPAIGVPELREAIAGLYRRELGLDYPVECVLAASGARPPLYAAFRAIIEPGDKVVYPVPSWNINHYSYITQAEQVCIETDPDNGFMLTASDLKPHLSTARMVVLNSPLNPAGTVAGEELLREVCQAIVAENARRRQAGDRPLMLLYDQVYWRLTFGEYKHHTPVGLVPEMFPYTIMVDAVSKWWAGTGLRVGWCVCPPWIRHTMQAFIGHMGAWPARAERMAVADVLNEPALTADFDADFHSKLRDRLTRLRDGLLAMKADGLPVDALDAQGAIYLSAQFDLIGRTTPDGEVIATDEDVRSYLLHDAGVAIVPFTAFGYAEKTGWVRFSVGSVTLDNVDAALQSIGESVSRLR